MSWFWIAVIWLCIGSFFGALFYAKMVKWARLGADINRAYGRSTVTPYIRLTLGTAFAVILWPFTLALLWMDN